MAKAGPGSWSGNREAQRQADSAYAKLKARKKRKRNKRQLRQEERFVRLDYYVYLASPAWSKKRRRFIREAGGKCQTCGSNKRLQVHHKHYRTLGRERRRDVRVLCDDCHSLEHEQDGVAATDELSEDFRKMMG